jgi:alpha-beta hydrolase superfamily lysophospholipase
VLFRPSKPALDDRLPGVVLCHGYNAVKEVYLPPLAAAMADAGFVALTFDYRGFGESEGTPGRLIPLEQVEDARNAITFLASQSSVDSKRLGVFGTSFGGGIAIAAAAADSRVGAVVSNVPVCNGERWLRGMRPHWEWVDFLQRLQADRVSRVLTGASESVDPAVIAPPDPGAHSAHRAQVPQRQLRLESAEAILEFKPEHLVECISPRPLLMIIAEKDRRVPPEVSLPTFHRAREPKALKILQGVDHHAVYELPTRSDLLAIVLPWLREQLDGQSRSLPITSWS